MFTPVGSRAKLTPQASIEMSEQNAREAHSSFDSVDHGFMINHGKTLTVTPKFLEQEQPPADANDSAHANNNFQQKTDMLISNTEKTKKEQSSSSSNEHHDDYDGVSQQQKQQRNDKEDDSHL